MGGCLFQVFSLFGGLILNVYMFNQWGEDNIHGGWFFLTLIVWLVLSVWSTLYRMTEPDYDFESDRKNTYMLHKKCPYCRMKLPSYFSTRCPHCTSKL